jgi:hypothetical protein
LDTLFIGHGHDASLCHIVQKDSVITTIICALDDDGLVRCELEHAGYAASTPCCEASKGFLLLMPARLKNDGVVHFFPISALRAEH